MLSLRTATRQHGRETIEALRGKVGDFRSAALPRVAEAAENTGEAVSKFALSSSQHVAQAVRRREPSKSTAFATVLPPLLRVGMRFAARNPAVVVAGGLGLAALGVVAWRRQRRVTEEVGESSQGPADDLEGWDEPDSSTGREL